LNRYLRPVKTGENHKINYKIINDYLSECIGNKIELTFDEFLNHVNLSEQQYLYAIRSSLVRSRVFLKRNIHEVNINAYNNDILNFHQGNMDIQFILNPYACIGYIVSYINKSQRGMSDLIKRAVLKAQYCNSSISQRLKTISNVFVNSSEIGVQEAVYNILSMKVSFSSRASVYINTLPIADRLKVIKSKEMLEYMDKDSSDIFVLGLIDHYKARPTEMQELSLAEVAAYFNIEYKNKKTELLDDENDDEDNNYNLDDDENNQEIFAVTKKVNFVKRRKPKIIRYRRYMLENDPENYYREMCMLWLPWREENESSNYHQIYKENECKIIANYVNLNGKFLEQKEIDVAIELAVKERESTSSSDDDSSEDDNTSNNEQCNFFADIGIEKNTVSNKSHFVVPQKISDNDYSILLRELNDTQRRYFLNLVNLFKKAHLPINHFITGNAGTGKSRLIKAIYHYLNKLLNMYCHSRNDTQKILLCAPTGKASYNIEGQTTFSAFFLPVNQLEYSSLENYPSLLNTFRCKYKDLKLIIIDEISMVGRRQFKFIDLRLREIFAVNKPFGNISIIVVGDFNQLAPVLDSWIFSIDKNNLSDLIGSSIWKKFLIVQLTEIMRQKDKEFSLALSNLAQGKMTNEEIKLFKSREVTKSHVIPRDTVYLFYDRISVRTFNARKLAQYKTEQYMSVAIDKVRGVGTKEQKDYILKKAASIDDDPSNQISYSIHLKLEAKYMLLVNLNVADGLTNGSSGILKRISYDKNNVATLIWIQFDNLQMGSATRLSYSNIMKDLSIQNCTPIERYMSVITSSKQKTDGPLQVHRYQFPVICSEAITIHKSQGLTLPSVVLKLKYGKFNRKISRRLLYVGCSRVTNLEGLFFDGQFEPPEIVGLEDETYVEMNRLLTTSNLNYELTFLQDINNCSLKVVFQNVQSFRKHKMDIISDPFFMMADVLIFVEVGVVDSSLTNIPNFYLLSSTFQEKKCRGYLVFVKTNLIKRAVFITDNVDRMTSSNIELFVFKINNIGIIGVYKSPSKSLNDISKELEKIKYEKLIKDNQLSQIFMLGDFNHDLNDSIKRNKAENFMVKYGLKSVIDNGNMTTDGNTLIDWCLTNVISGFQFGIYESYFSYHKPIWFAMNSLYQKSNDEDEFISSFSECDISDSNFINISSTTIDDSVNRCAIYDNKWITTITTSPYSTSILNKYRYTVETKPLTEFLLKHKLQIIPQPKDGKCLINSIIKFFELDLKLIINLNDFKKRYSYHMLNDIDYLKDFMPLSEDFIEAYEFVKLSLENLFNHGEYNNDFTDVFMNSFSRYFGTKVLIIEDRKPEIHIIPIMSTTVQLKNIYPIYKQVHLVLLRSGTRELRPHYDYITSLINN